MGLFMIGVGVFFVIRGVIKVVDYIKEIIWGWRFVN